MRVLPVFSEVRTIPFVTNRTVIAICIRIGLREVVLGIWGNIFHKTILGKPATICGKDDLCGAQSAIKKPQITQSYVGFDARKTFLDGLYPVPSALPRSISCTCPIIAVQAGCPLTLTSPKMYGFGKVFYRWLIPTSSFRAPESTIYGR